METKDAKLIQFKRKMPAVEDELIDENGKKYMVGQLKIRKFDHIFYIF